MGGYFYSFKELKAKEPSKGIKVRSVYLENLMMTTYGVRTLQYYTGT